MPFALRNSDGNLLLLAQFNVSAISWWKKRERKVWMSRYSFMFSALHAHTSTHVCQTTHTHTLSPCSPTMKSMLSVLLCVQSILRCQRLLVIKRHIIFCNFWYRCEHSTPFVLWRFSAFTLCWVDIKEAFLLRGHFNFGFLLRWNLLAFVLVWFTPLSKVWHCPVCVGTTSDRSCGLWRDGRDFQDRRALDLL